MIIQAPEILNRISKYIMGMLLFPFILVRYTPPTPFANITINHEKIHFRQAWELLVIGFYLQYVIEFVLYYIKYKNKYTAYRAISFEQEAYANQFDLTYLQIRQPYAWFNYLGKKLAQPKIYPILYQNKK